MPLDPPFGIDDPTGAYEYSAADFRRWQSGLLAHDLDVLSARPGVLLGLSASAADLVVTVAAGQCVVNAGGPSEGSYVVVVSDAEPVELDPRDTTYSRIDRLAVRVQDPLTTGGVVRQGTIVVVTGTAAASPSPPPVPAGYLPVCRVTVPPAGAASIVDERQWTASVGGTIPCTSTTRPAGSFIRPGQKIVETDTGLEWIWVRGAWRLNGGSTGWTGLATATGVTGSAQWRVAASNCEVRYDVTVDVSSDMALVTQAVPVAYRATGYSIAAGEAIIDPGSTGGTAKVYVDQNSGVLRGSNRGGATWTKARGRVSWMIGD